MKIAQACTRPAVTAATSATLSEVAALMRDRNVGAVVITQSPASEPVPVGLITDRDIVSAQLEHTADLSRLAAEEVMTRNPLVLNEEDSVDDAIARMRARGVRRAPVISESGELVGAVSSDDLIATVAEDLIVLAYVLARQQSQPSR